MKKLSLALAAIFMFVASQAFAGGCPDGSCAANNDRNVSTNQEYADPNCPEICYVPCVKYEPQYYCCPRTVCYTVTSQKKCNACRDECYQVRRCKMVPQYYYETCTRKVPYCYYEPCEKQCTKTVYDKYCKMVPRCYYKKVVKPACGCDDNDSSNGGSYRADRPANGMTPAPTTPDLAPRKVAEGMSTPRG